MAATALTATVALLVAICMEGWAAWMHGVLWHGILWPAHRSHHPEAQTEGIKGRKRWEFNDIFGLCHAAVAAPMMMWGLTPPFDVAQQVALGASVGMTLFGLCYVIIHDGLVHGRLPVGKLRRIAYLRRVVAAHRVHHKLGGAPYGLFSGPWVLRREARARRTSGAQRLAQTRIPG